MEFFSSEAVGVGARWSMCGVDRELRTDFAFFEPQHAHALASREYQVYDAVSEYYILTQHKPDAALFAAASKHCIALAPPPSPALTAAQQQHGDGDGDHDMTAVAVAAFSTRSRGWPSGTAYAIKSTTESSSSSSSIASSLASATAHVSGDVVDFGTLDADAMSSQMMHYLSPHQPQPQQQQHAQEGGANVFRIAATNRGNFSGVLDPNDYWIACGAKAVVGQYFRYHWKGGDAAGADASCERDCIPYIMNSSQSMSVVHEHSAALEALTNVMITTRAAETLSFHVHADDNELVSYLPIRVAHSDVCVGNKTDSSVQSCYRMYTGGGVQLSGVVSFCGKTMSTASVVDVCVRDWAECTATVVSDLGADTASPSSSSSSSSSCAEGNYPDAVIMYAVDKAGWHSAEYLLFRVADPWFGLFGDAGAFERALNGSASEGVSLVRRATLAQGQVGQDAFCLSDGCYFSDVLPGQDPYNVLWMHCGVMGGAGTPAIFEVSVM